MANTKLTPTIRKADAHDAPAIAAIYNHYVDVGGATFDTVHLSVSVLAKRIEERVPDGWYVADLGDAILGWASARRYSDRFGYRFCCETAIYLAPEAKGTGVADQLQHAINAHCLKYNLHHAVAKVIADNTRSMAFHLRHGYELVGVQKEIGRMNDRWVDVAILQKIYS